MNSVQNLSYKPRGQSLIEFAVLLPVVLILILLIVRMMLILNTWYTLTATADIAVRAAALTGSADTARRIVFDNLHTNDPTLITITFTPNVQVFYAPPTATATPRISPTPNLHATMTATPDQSLLLDPSTIPEHRIKIEIVLNEQIAGPLLPSWTIKLSANATARLEARLSPLPTLQFF